MQKSADSIVIFLIVTTCIILILASFIISIIYLYRKRQLTYLKDIEQIKSEYEKNLLRAQLEIREQTFQTISRDIHDNINLSLTLAKLNLNTLSFTNTEKSLEQINESIGFVSRAIDDLTDISRTMNSDVIAEHGLITALRQEMEKLKKINWFNIKFEVTGDPVFMDAQKDLFIFRIIQEAFNNIIKHSQASNIQLQLHYNDKNIEITVADDGIGFIMSNLKNQVKKQAGAGLRNMQKRAELLDGIFNIKSKQGAGTIIKLIIPF
jgi:signal transduction histidine kinase